MRTSGPLTVIGLFVLAVTAVAQTNTFPSSGSVGIGTTTPATKLQVIGNAAIGENTNGTAIIDAYNGNAFYGNNSATNGIAISPYGQVGIGGNPTDMFSVWLNTSVNTYAELVHFAIPNTGSGNFSSMKIGQIAPNQLFIDTSDQNNTKGSTLIQPWGGKVGINTANPTYSLDVAGAVRTTTAVVYPDGTQQTTAWTGTVCGGDYAESVDVTGDRTKYGPGDVLVIDPNDSGKFLKSAEPYSTAVMGIYSTKPGVTGRRQTTPKRTDEVPMAMIGIVPTKVTAENGPIHPGDLLVTSSSLGYAMKGTDRSKMLGAVIGKALGKLDSGKGVIEVGVTLQ